MKTLLLKLRDYVLTAFALVLCVLVVTALLATVFPSIGLALEDWTIHAKTRLFVGNSVTDVSFIALGDDSVRVQEPLTVNNNIISGTTHLAVKDSFTTTAVVDTVAMAGATEADVFQVTQWLPTYSTTPDTGSSPYAARGITGYAIVSRTKLTAAATLKSGAHFQVSKIDK